MRVRQPKTTALIFASGKMVVTGAKSEDDARLAARKYARIIQKLGFEASFNEFKIQNMVGSCDVKFPIRLEGLAFSHGHFSSYEPEVGLHPLEKEHFMLTDVLVRSCSLVSSTAWSSQRLFFSSSSQERLFSLVQRSERIFTTPSTIYTPY